LDGTWRRVSSNGGPTRRSGKGRSPIHGRGGGRPPGKNPPGGIQKRGSNTSPGTPKAGYPDVSPRLQASSPARPLGPRHGGGCRVRQLQLVPTYFRRVPRQPRSRPGHSSGDLQTPGGACLKQEVGNKVPSGRRRKWGRGAAGDGQACRSGFWGAVVTRPKKRPGRTTVLRKLGLRGTRLQAFSGGGRYKGLRGGRERAGQFFRGGGGAFGKPGRLEADFGEGREGCVRPSALAGKGFEDDSRPGGGAARGPLRGAAKGRSMGRAAARPRRHRPGGGLNRNEASGAGL